MYISPLFLTLEKTGADFVEASGWQQADHFGDPAAEARAAREYAALADLSASAKILVEGERSAEVVEEAFRAEAAALPVGAGLAQGSTAIYRLRADQFFVHAVAGEEAGLLPAVQRSAGTGMPFTTVTDLTHGRAEIAVVGPRAAELLSRLCGLNFSDSTFPNLAARQSSVAKTQQLILRRDLGGAPAFALIGDRSLGEYLWQTAMQAGADLEIAAVGLQALAELAAGL
jgi:sarcosine oxidase subunit alpha